MVARHFTKVIGLVVDVTFYGEIRQFSRLLETDNNGNRLVLEVCGRFSVRTRVFRTIAMDLHEGLTRGQEVYRTPVRRS